MKFSCKFRKYEGDGKLLGFADLTISGALVITGIKLMNGTNGMFIGMPSKKMPDGTYKDIVFPLSKEVRQEMTKAVLDEYLKTKGETENSDFPF